MVRIASVWGVVCLCCALSTPARAEAADYDLALRGATLYRGGFELAGTGDVAIRGDRIVAVGEAPGRARREIDARGLVAAPGFIDLHNHTDEAYGWLGWLPLPPDGREIRNYLTQGVTTIVTGNCGTGPALPEEVAAWLRRADDTPFGTNVIQLVPHGSLRLAVMGSAQADRADPAPTPDELARMEALLDASLREGAWGLSTGLEYDPGARASTDEIVALAKRAASVGGVYASHTRHEGPDPARTLASYDEAIEIAERAGITAQISHIKTSGRPVHGLSAEIIDRVEKARARGVRVYADQYPYAASNTGLTQVVPVALRDGSRVLARHCEEEGRHTLREAVEGVMSTEMPAESILVTTYPWRFWLQGRTVAEIAAERGVDPTEVAMDLACGPIGFATYFTQSEDDVRRFMTRDWVATASDGVGVFWPLGRITHPRVHGTFPRKIRRYAIDEAVISLAFALRSMSELPAAIFGIPERGRLEPGFFADVVTFDPKRIRDVATFDAPGVESEGVETLIVNGVVSIDGGRPTGDRGGRALRLASDRTREAARATGHPDLARGVSAR
ncbi:D-aminoacylase [Burkholderiales bacterium]|nr:D-aminoacylase [Burkholderiales bacterium]